LIEGYNANDGIGDEQCVVPKHLTSKAVSSSKNHEEVRGGGQEGDHSSHLSQKYMSSTMMAAIFRPPVAATIKA
jgi:hypothetical protein